MRRKPKLESEPTVEVRESAVRPWRLARSSSQGRPDFEYTGQRVAWDGFSHEENIAHIHFGLESGEVSIPRSRHDARWSTIAATQTAKRSRSDRILLRDTRHRTWQELFYDYAMEIDERSRESKGIRVPVRLVNCRGTMLARSASRLLAKNVRRLQSLILLIFLLNSSFSFSFLL